jgi:methylthioribulose-1-phosphate dehydratase
VVSRDPLRLAITASGVDKGQLTADHVLEIGGDGAVQSGSGAPSAEASLHLVVARERGPAAGAVLHTHSVWSTMLSDTAAGERGAGLAIEGYEMLKGLDGIHTHEHREWLPIVENRQDWSAAAPGIASMLAKHPAAHGFLIRRHGLYTWGKDLAAAKRHVEVLEFLLEVMARKRGNAWQP